MPMLWDFEARQCETIYFPSQMFEGSHSVVCLVTGDNARKDFFPLACLANAFLLELALSQLTGQFYLVLACITLGP